MTLRIKKIIAREFLLLICPLLILGAVVLITEIRYSQKIENLYQLRSQKDERIMRVVDSLRKADNVEYHEILTRLTKNGQSRKIAELKDYYHSKTYATEPRFGKPVYYLTNIYGETVYFPKSFVESKKEIQSQIDDEQSLREQLIGDDWDEGIILGVYFLLLMIIYPVRFLILSLIWSIRTLRANPS